jgi:hypothetical protein
MSDTPTPGEICWQDLTVENATALRDFYCATTGWTATEHAMGEYSDYCMNLPGSGKTIAGVCHARGSNAGIPPQWLIYIAVQNLDHSMEQCTTLGGEIVDGPRDMGGKRFCVIKDPAGAVAGLIESIDA